MIRYAGVRKQGIAKPIDMAKRCNGVLALFRAKKRPKQCTPSPHMIPMIATAFAARIVEARKDFPASFLARS